MPNPETPEVGPKESGLGDKPISHAPEGQKTVSEKRERIHRLASELESSSASTEFSERLIGDEDSRPDLYADLLMSLRGKPLVDLACGHYDKSAVYVIDLAERGHASSYIGVDKFKQNKAYKDHAVPVSFETVDMLEYLSSLPDRSANIIINGVDEFIIADSQKNREYLDTLAKEIERVVAYDGIKFGYSSYIVDQVKGFDGIHRKEFVERRQTSAEFCATLEELASDPKLWPQTREALSAQLPDDQREQFLSQIDGLIRLNKWREVEKSLLAESSPISIDSLKQLHTELQKLESQMEAREISARDLRKNQEVYDWLGFDIDLKAELEAGRIIFPTPEGRAYAQEHKMDGVLLIPGTLSREQVFEAVKKRFAEEFSSPWGVQQSGWQADFDWVHNSAEARNPSRPPQVYGLFYDSTTDQLNNPTKIEAGQWPERLQAMNEEETGANIAGFSLPEYLLLQSLVYYQGKLDNPFLHRHYDTDRRCLLPTELREDDEGYEYFMGASFSDPKKAGRLEEARHRRQYKSESLIKEYQAKGIDVYKFTDDQVDEMYRSVDDLVKKELAKKNDIHFSIGDVRPNRPMNCRLAIIPPIK